MINSIEKLKSILSQASNIADPFFFFPLLHEFALNLTRPYFNEACRQIQAEEEKMKTWIDSMPHHPTAELKQSYYDQYKTVAAWYSLNQIMVFFERYDFAYHDIAIQNLTQKNIDTAQFRKEHYAMISYARTGICPSIFPTIEEYKHYMRRVIDALENILINAPSSLAVHTFHFDKKSNILFLYNE